MIAGLAGRFPERDIHLSETGTSLKKSFGCGSTDTVMEINDRLSFSYVRLISGYFSMS
jgi:hypothetical protein